jgi:hypothetical protein
MNGLKIGPHYFGFVETDCPDLFGEMNGAKLQISLLRGMPTTLRLDTILHEAMHAVWWIGGLKKSVNEEEAVAALASGMLAVLRDNPWLREALADDATYA